jgi:hypothetical protein
MRDPTILGGELIESLAEKQRRYPALALTASDVLDGEALGFMVVPSFHDPTTSLARYGDPRERHQHRLDTGTEPLV